MIFHKMGSNITNPNINQCIIIINKKTRASDPRNNHTHSITWPATIDLYLPQIQFSITGASFHPWIFLHNRAHLTNSPDLKFHLNMWSRAQNKTVCQFIQSRTGTLPWATTSDLMYIGAGYSCVLDSSTTPLHIDLKRGIDQYQECSKITS